MARRGPGAGRRRSPGTAAAATEAAAGSAGGRRAGTADGGGTQAADPRARARQICLNLLTTKARTRAELVAALARRGIDEDTAGDVLARFSEVGLIDDAAFAESFVHAGHTYRGLGRRALAMQLRRRGVDEQTTGDAVAAVDPRAEEEMARTMVRRLAGGVRGGAHSGDEVSTIRQLVGMLARRGYPQGLSYRVVRDELRAAGRDADLLDAVDLDATD